MILLNIENIGKSFAGSEVVSDISLGIDEGELVSLLGPSGSGKSTILRMIGGFEQPGRGDIRIDGQSVLRTPPERRPTAMIFQSHALWSHMSVFGNIAFGLKLRGLRRAEIAQKVEAALSLMGMEGFGPRRIWQLSGGQQQRVAIARAIVLEPRILLLDEPFASLDQHLRERLRDEVRDIQRRLGMTMIFVTHAQDEAMSISDRVVVLNKGRIEQAAGPSEIYRAPATRFVAGFIGQMNHLAAEMRGGTGQINGVGAGVLPFRAALPDGPAEIGFRPEAVELRPGTQARITRVTDFGSYKMVAVSLGDDGQIIRAQVPGSQDWQAGQSVDPVISELIAYRGDQVIAAAPARAAVRQALHANG
ncbi:MAG: ABC transporter ATP-binding protein [Paracoccus sp. (in: a-proteobacteria)]|nr:ABC transporter ATP-binding protein [Paracoccus sp. (in: a-proteobacteria)]